MAHLCIASGAQAMLNKAEDERSGVLSTALAFLGLYADPIVARNTADSDFRIADLMQGKAPMSLYLIVPDSDRLRLKPFTRLMITLFAQRLCEREARRANRHRLLMLLDEFPRLGRMSFLNDALSYVAGYGIKIMLIIQDIPLLENPDVYGKGSTPVDGSRIRVVMTPQDPRTAEWISGQLGQSTEVHQQTTYMGHRLSAWRSNVIVSDQQSERALLDPAEVGKMPESDQIVLVKGFSPFYAKRLRYYEDPELARRAAIPAPPLRAERPYPYRPAPRPNPWITVLAPPPPDIKPLPAAQSSQAEEPVPAPPQRANDLSPPQEPGEERNVNDLEPPSASIEPDESAAQLAPDEEQLRQGRRPPRRGAPL